ncbi:MAG: hypothetical protein II909_01185 [Kiritimatiellae bacterium]|nr:hypothetical protein [Kiritimatiellia bacterium]
MFDTVLMLAVLRLAAPFSDGMVMQRQMPVRIWGEAAPDSVIRVVLEKDSAKTVAGEDGRWFVELPPRGASKKGVKLTVSEYKKTLLSIGEKTDERTVEDIIFGEVWYASGQSNMECPIWGDNPRFRDEKGAMMIEMSNLPYVRFTVNQKLIDGVPQHKLEPEPQRSRWRAFTREGLKPRLGEPYTISAVAFYFARELYLALDVPVGIVESAWGGTPIEAWTPRCAISDQELEESLANSEGRISSSTPSALFTGMVADFCPMPMRGLIWYQGCSNKHDSSARYLDRMNRFYAGWTQMFENPDLKMYFAQLAPYETGWMNICMAQTQFAAENPNAAMVVLSDSGNFRDIHPNRKDIVGARLAMHALRRDYGFEMDGDDSPAAVQAKFQGGQVTVDFENVKKWYIYSADRSESPAFELCGADGEWKSATITNGYSHDRNMRGVVNYGPSLILEAEGVAAPCGVRYMGRNKTCGTLYNELSLPLGPFEILQQ